ncbi:MFS transporter [Sphingomonas baiyangensis]|uniref:MFS transporter n=1 Tax=Sphingomonas baiyangensis TaxID=2572576 RepID=A0A4U1L3I0_9SPHN|nr:MFS transporter [Sphingomonas baiyangensis]TKD50666.1 MFS transporter [Sphingomonas baiyangensis]
MNEATTGRSADIESLLDRPFGGWRLAVFLMCGAIMAVEGFDMYMLGAIVPALAAGVGVSPAAIAGVFVAQGIGLAIGYTALSPFADRYGRRPVILLCVAGFGLVTLATVLATTLTHLMILRLVAFIFFGGVVPNTISLVAELAALRLRERMVVLLSAFLAFGAASGSALAPLLVNGFGWQGAFWAGGIAPLVLLPILYAFLPESPRFLIVKGSSPERVRRSLVRIVPEAAGIEQFTTIEPRSEKVPVAALFAEGRFANTLLLTLAGGMMMLVGNLVASWTPTYLNALAGYSMQQGAALFATSSIGAIAWPFVMIVLIERIGLKNAVVLCYALGFAAMLSFMVTPFTPAWAVFLSVSYGAFVVGAISGLYALIAAAYPTQIRATALGWTSGIGRLLSIMGPAVGGFMLAEGYGQTPIALVYAVPLAIAGIAVALVRLRTAPSAR